MANRSEEDSLSPKDEGHEAARPFRLSLGRQLRHDDVEFNELDIRLRVSYKTLLLVFVLFDVAHRIVNSLSDSAFIQGILS